MKTASVFRRLLTAAAAMLAFAAPGRAAENNPVANPEAVVVCGNARFTVLTPEMIRMEWSPQQNFEDRASLTFVNRNLPVPRFTAKTSAKGTTIRTDAVTLTYKNDGKPFSPANLKIKYRAGKKWAEWVPGMKDTLNLKGTTRTLDGCDGVNLGREPLEDGLLSRGGWTVVDDSRNHLFTPVDSHWKEWVDVRPDSLSSDLYFMAYGHDYKRQLGDYQKVAGRASLPPKYTFGYWWSRYWQYSDNEFYDLVKKIKSVGMPIDVLIVDMDWHETYGLRSKKAPKDEYGQRIGWTGYSWQKQLFPHPQNFLKWTEREGLKVALNLHPASGIQPYEDCYKEFAKAYNWTDTTRSIPYRMSDPKWADAYFSTILEPMERDGVDFWWLDWQQWRESKYVPGLNNTFWLNDTFFRHAAKRASASNERPFIYHRWGGLGSHRYPLGFSGDTYIKWSTLAYLPEFTATSSNVNYGYWGHDIGGHYFKHDGKPHSTDPELYLRWIQYGVFTPIFKTHSTKDMDIVRYPWAFPDHMFKFIEAIKLRYSLVPYIYNAARANYDTGVAMTRPMYYEYPEAEQAYRTPSQFFFGPDILASCIAQPVDSVTGLAPLKMWFPEGKWYDYASGRLIEGNSEVTADYTLSENPFYLRAGAIIPMLPDTVRSVQQASDRNLVLTFIPGADGELEHYEDDGVSADYTSQFATTKISKNIAGDNVNVTISPRKGTYAGATSERSYELRFPAMMPPKEVTVNGTLYPYSRFPAPGQWTYDAYSLQPVVYTKALPVDAAADIVLAYAPGEIDNAELYGKRAVFNRCLDLTVDFKNEQGLHGESMAMLPVEYLKVSQCPNFINEDPANIRAYLSDFTTNLDTLGKSVDKMKLISPEFRERLRAQILR